MNANTAEGSTVRNLAGRALRSVGIEEPLRRAYWRLRLWRKTVRLELEGLERDFHAVDQQMRSRLLRFSNERDQIAELIRNVRPGDVVWDVGAYVGLYTLFAAAKAAPGGTVCAFEPETRTRTRLANNVRLNRADNVRILDCALSDERGESSLYLDARPGSVGRLGADAGRVKAMKITLETGDRLVERGAIPPPNLVKIDVEGAEFKTLKGMSNAVANPACRFVILEVHPADMEAFDHKPEQVAAFFEERGFERREVARRGSEEHWSMYRP